MKSLREITEAVFTIGDEDTFEKVALALFRWQATHNPVYEEYLDNLGVEPDTINAIGDIPHLPIEAFKYRSVRTGAFTPETEFRSSGTTESSPAVHAIRDLRLYDEAWRGTFERFYGPLSQYCILALLPTYVERSDASLIHMVKGMMERSDHPANGFYLDEHEALAGTLRELEAAGQSTLLIGVSFALLQFARTHKLQLEHSTVIETGGMKGQEREMVREELHAELKQGFGVDRVHSEYGMTELLSQAWAKGEGRFQTPPWMQVSIRDLYDPFSTESPGRTGGINIVDLANVHSCAFLETGDIGRQNGDGTFEVLGRMDNSDLRGCNLMVT